MSVIGSAALKKDDIKYDNIDDADLTYEQVATIALDLVDNDLLAGMDTIDLSIVGELRLDSLDHVLADIKSLRSGLIWSIGKDISYYKSNLFNAQILQTTTSNVWYLIYVTKHPTLLNLNTSFSLLVCYRFCCP